MPYTREGFWRWIKLPPFYATRTSSTLFSPFGSTGGLFWIDPQEKEDTMQARRSGSNFPPMYIESTRWRAQ